MKRFSLILVLIAVVSLCHASLRSQLIAARKIQEKAVLARNMKAVKSAVIASATPDFKYVQGTKIESLQAYIQDFCSTVAMMSKITSSSMRILSLQEKGNQGSGKVVLTMIGTMIGPHKKLHAINWSGEFVERFRKVGSAWKTAAMVQGPQKFIMDGKPVKL